LVPASVRRSLSAQFLKSRRHAEKYNDCREMLSFFSTRGYVDLDKVTRLTASNPKSTFSDLFNMTYFVTETTVIQCVLSHLKDHGVKDIFDCPDVIINNDKESIRPVLTALPRVVHFPSSFEGRMTMRRPL
jgi:hypothetical protein